MTVTRYDRAPIKATKTPEGFVQDSPVLSRVGVFEYRQPDGTIRKEFRPPEEVFHADHLASLHAKPITSDHHGKITVQNAKGKTIGAVLTPGRQDGDNLVADIVIHDASDIPTKRELSLGYTLDLDETPGEYNGTRYDAVQRNIRVNHLALVAKGRAGNARLNLDAADAVISIPEENEPIMTTVKLRLDSGLEYDAPPEVAVAYAAATAKVSAEKDRADGLQAKLDAAEGKITKHEADIATIREDARKQAAARVKLETDAKALGAKFAEDAKDSDIRIAVIKAVRGDSVDLKDKTEAYIEAAYDLARADGEKARQNAGNARQNLGTPPVEGRQDGAGPAKGSAAAARAGMVNSYTPKAGA